MIESRKNWVRKDSLAIIPKKQAMAGDLSTRNICSGVSVTVGSWPLILFTDFELDLLDKIRTNTLCINICSVMINIWAL